MCSGYKDLVTTGALQHIPLQHCRAPADTTQQNTQHAASCNKKWRQNTNLIIRLKVLETDQSALQCLVVVVPAAVCRPNILLSLLQLWREEFYKSGAGCVALCRGDPRSVKQKILRRFHVRVHTTNLFGSATCSVQALKCLKLFPL